uniref:DNA (cytosine-5)-methyltransferase n=1 Tax=Rhizophagus irregularis TaxID=588596 RepID=A0A1C9II53_9GLOM|nr:C-5 cytosine-specific DNA methylase [Rhizophagus irregularis]
MSEFMNIDDQPELTEQYLNDVFPDIFKKFPNLDYESIRNAIEEADYDQEIAIEALSSNGDCSNSSSFSNIQDDDDMNVDEVTKQKQINDEINKIIDVSVKVVIEPSKYSTSGIDNGYTSSSSSSDDVFKPTRLRTSTIVKRKVEQDHIANSTAKDPKEKAEKKPDTGKTYFYEYREGEVEESESFELIGEDPVVNQGAGEEFNADKASLPCRKLEEFTIYDANRKNKLVSIEELDEEGRELHVSGIVKPIFVGQDDEDLYDEYDDDDGPVRVPDQYFRTSTIFYFQIEYSQDGQSEIWIRTQYAFYKLLNASEAYVPYFMPVFKKIRTANVIIEAIASNPEITYDQFLELLKQPPVASSSSSLSNVEITEKDILNNIDYIYQELETWVDEKEAFGVLLCPLLTSLQRLVGKKRKKPKYTHGDTDTVKTKRNVNPNLAVLQHQNPTCVTPFINNLTKGMFANKFVTIRHDNEIDHADKKIEAPVIKKPITHKVIWSGDQIAKSDEITYYNCAVVDGEEITVGDIVYVRNDDSDEPWFAKVMYMFEDSSRKKMFHSRFFNHGKAIFLEEFAGDREIFLLDNCTDNELETVMGKAKVKRLDIDEDESFDFEDEHFYFYRFWYDEKYATFEEALLHEDQNAVYNYCEEHETCHSCENFYAAEQKKEAKWIYQDSQDTPIGFTYNGVDYHHNDFVYIIPDEGSENVPYEIGQIVEILNDDEKTLVDYFEKKNKKKNKEKKRISKPVVCVRLLGRYDDLLKSKLSNKISETATYRDIIHDPREVKDCRRLFLKDDVKIIRNVNKLEGVCWVEHKDRINNLSVYKDEMDTFYIDCKTTKKHPNLSDLENMNADDIQLCVLCKEKRQNYQKDMSEFVEYLNIQQKKLKAMDIFSGCGGLTVGMDRTGIVETKWAIEFASSAALTFEINNPHAVAYNQCANLLLERAIAEHSRKEQLKPLQDFLGRNVPSMPAPGDVDFIYCGPPCQGFSGVNRYQKADDIKNSLVATALSYVDFYRPEFFLLENVRGMLSFRLGGKQDGNKILGGIKMGVIKFIIRSLTAMGYQTKFSVQQAGHHGVPQSRRRLFIWGVKRGSYLPNFPQPSTCFSKQGSINVLLPDGTSFTYNHRTNGYAPYPAVSVREAINDLPEFEFVNPHQVYPAEKEDKELQRPFRQIEVPERGWVGDIETEYGSEPLSEYQRQSRKDCARVYNHICRVFNKLTIERIVRIAMFPGADHSSLPEKLKPWCLSDPNSAASRHNGWKGLFGRLDFEGHFVTALTDINPMGKTGTVVHPNQRRLLTVRECARAQGFPDKFRFYSDRDDTKDMHRQIGNAVPPPLAYALGRLLVEAVFKKHMENKKLKGKGKLVV